MRGQAAALSILMAHQVRLPPITYYLLPTTYCLLPATDYLLSTTYYLLPTAYCLLPTTLHSSPTSHKACPGRKAKTSAGVLLGWQCAGAAIVLGAPATGTPLQRTHPSHTILSHTTQRNTPHHTTPRNTTSHPTALSSSGTLLELAFGYDPITQTKNATSNTSSNTSSNGTACAFGFGLFGGTPRRTARWTLWWYVAFDTVSHSLSPRPPRCDLFRTHMI